jgi:hypothetical protein
MTEHGRNTYIYSISKIGFKNYEGHERKRYEASHQNEKMIVT